MDTFDREARWRIRDWAGVVEGEEDEEALLVVCVWEVVDVEVRGTGGAEEGVWRRTFRCRRLRIPLRRRVVGSGAPAPAPVALALVLALLLDMTSPSALELVSAPEGTFNPGGDTAPSAAALDPSTSGTTSK